MRIIIAHAVNAPTTFVSWAVKAMFRSFGVLRGFDSSEPMPGVSPSPYKSTNPDVGLPKRVSCGSEIDDLGILTQDTGYSGRP